VNFEIFAFFGILILILVVLAEMHKRPLLGLVASFFLLILGYWVWAEGIWMQSGATALVQLDLHQDQNRTGTTGNSTTSTTVSGEYVATNASVSVAPTYAEITSPSFSMRYLLGFTFVLLALVGLWSYATVKYTK